jgi:plasmid rolling circle replication initiator protein Rep
VSDQASDAAINSVTSNVTEEPAIGLSDLSERDQVWDKHKANNDKTALHYVGSEFEGYSTRMTFCSEVLEFQIVAGERRSSLKLTNARFCRVRHCPICQWRRSLMWKAKAYKVIPKVAQAFPTHRWLFLTLTVKNCPIGELRQTLDKMNKAFKRLTELKVWPGEGWIKSVEVTKGQDSPMSAHPHFHVLLMVPSGYFGKNYIKQDEWVQMWQRCLRVDYKPMLHIRPVKKEHDPTVIIPEILKYQIKESDLVSDRDWFLELTRQLHKTRAVAVGGVLREYLRELEQEPEDLIGESEDPTEADEGGLFFNWKRNQKRYLLSQ